MTTQDGPLLIDGVDNETQLRVQGDTTQTQPLQTWENSAGVAMAQLTGDGRLEVGSLDMGTPDALIEANRDENSSLPQRGIQALGRISGAIANAIAWAVHELELTGTGSVSGLHAALRARLTQKKAEANADLRAGDFEAINEGGSTTPVNNLTGIHSAVTNETGASLSEAVGVGVQISNQGTLSEAYGVKVEDVDQAEANYAVYTGKGTVRLGDVIEAVEQTDHPANPPEDSRKLYPKSDGWYDLGSTGDPVKIGTGGGSGAELTTITENLYTRTLLLDDTLASDGTWDEMISQDYDHLEIWLLARSDRAATSDDVKVYFNNDLADANYAYDRHSGGNEHSTGGDTNAKTAIITGNTGVANAYGIVRIFVPNYAEVGKRKISHGESVCESGDRYIRINDFGRRWNNTTAINRIRIIPNSGTNFKTGSRVQVFGIKETTVVTDVSGNVTADLTGVVQDNDFEQAGDVLVGTDAGEFDQYTLEGNNKYLGTDGNGAVGVFDLPSGGVSVQIPAAGLCQGRITLTSGMPVTIADVVSATQVFFTPFRGNQLSLYDGADWEVFALTEVSTKLTDTQDGTTASGSAVVTGLTDTSQLAVGMEVSGVSIPANTTIQSIDSASQVTLDQNAISTSTNSLTFKIPADTNVDLFCYRSGMTPKLDMVLWAGDTTRATALAQLDGVPVMNGENTRRYMGTIRTTAIAGQSEDSELRRFVFNAFNPAPRKLKVVETTSEWTYSGSIWRPVRNQTTNRVEVIIGRPGSLTSLHAMLRFSGSGSGAAHGIGYDTTTDTSADLWPNVTNMGNASVYLEHAPAEGYHFYQWVENARGNSTTMYGSALSGFQSGMTGFIWM
jgi:hypothetical protein